MSKIWLKSPDPNKQCCGCEGKTSPCSPCCSGFSVAIDSITNGVSNYTNLDVDGLIDQSDPECGAYKNRPFGVQIYDCKVLAGTSESIEIDPSKSIFIKSNNSFKWSRHDIGFAVNFSSGDILTVSGHSFTQFDTVPAIYQNRTFDLNPPFYLENFSAGSSSSSYNVRLTNINRAPYFLDSPWAEFIDPIPPIDPDFPFPPFSFGGETLGQVNPAYELFQEFDTNFICRGSSTGCRTSATTSRCQKDDPNLFSYLSKRTYGGSFNIIQNYTCAGGPNWTISNYSDNIDDYIEKVNEDRIENSPPDDFQKYLCMDELLSQPFDNRPCVAAGTFSRTITANYTIYYSTNWPSSSLSIELNPYYRIKFLENSCVHFELAQLNSGEYRNVIASTNTGTFIKTYSLNRYQESLFEWSGSSNIIPLRFYPTTCTSYDFDSPIPCPNQISLP